MEKNIKYLLMCAAIPTSIALVGGDKANAVDVEAANTSENTTTVSKEVATNNKDKIPKQLLREGRIDFICEIGKLEKDEAIEMCQYYNVNKDKILKEYGEAEKYNPSKLENIIFNKLIGSDN